MGKKSGERDNLGFDNPLFFLMVMDEEDPKNKMGCFGWIFLFIIFACLLTMCGN